MKKSITSGRDRQVPTRETKFTWLLTNSIEIPINPNLTYNWISFQLRILHDIFQLIIARNLYAVRFVEMPEATLWKPNSRDRLQHLGLRLRFSPRSVFKIIWQPLVLVDGLYAIAIVIHRAVVATLTLSIRLCFHACRGRLWNTLRRFAIDEQFQVYSSGTITFIIGWNATVTNIGIIALRFVCSTPFFFPSTLHA